jgi:hypothetical protein
VYRPGPIDESETVPQIEPRPTNKKSPSRLLSYETVLDSCSLRDSNHTRICTFLLFCIETPAASPSRTRQRE